MLRASAAEFPDAVRERLLRELGERGLVAVQLDEPLSNDRFTTLGSLLGTASPETDPAVLPYVERGVILNLVAEHGRTEDVSLQPFATNPLTLHSEGSGRRAEEQPRYIVLMCRDPGDEGTAAQTVLVPMAAVAEGLSPDALATLEQTRYRRSPDGPWIARRVDGRWVFSFRDFLSQPLEWTHAGHAPSADAINGALRDLLASMYAPGAAIRVHWTRGKLVIIDNTFFFHGRTAGRSAGSSRRRHLQRLRILAGPSA
ncbi:TauD/TfdA family dioxygenase [Sorangium sp. So ce302]|uniref:TauD/TfdA family dioxygenase n=1 Tax=Sorangium sp. So ce302 TaxID=3133297 RepID=UPI003F620DF5